MKTIFKNLMVLFWGAILGMVLGYIGSQLEGLTADFQLCAVLGAVLALVAANVWTFMTVHANPER